MALREAFRIDCSCRKSIQELLDAARSENEHDRDRRMGFGNGLTLRDVQQMYDGLPLEIKGEAVFFVLKLTAALLEYGQNTVDAELMLLNVSHRLGLPHAHFNLGARSAQISFGGGPAHLLNCKMELIIDKLLDVTNLAKHVARCKEVDTTRFLCTLDNIVDRPLPYGWFVAILNLEFVCSWAALAAFMGSWQDMAAAALIVPFCLITQMFCARFGLKNLELVLCSIAVGIVTPVVWKHLVQVPLCHVPVLWGCAMLLYLPGCELIYGAYEIKYGSVINGASQLMAALVRCMIMGVGLTIGWQVFGRNAAETATGGKLGAIASMVPAQACTGPMGPPWYFVFGVLNFPMLFHCFFSLNMRIADMPTAFIVAYPSLFAFMALNVYGTFPGYVTDAIGMFIAANIGSAIELFQGTPLCVGIVPMVIILAPGWPSVSSVLLSMEKQAIPGVKASNFWTDLALSGASYAVGLSLALGLWRAWNHRALETPAFESHGDKEKSPGSDKSSETEESGSEDLENRPLDRGSIGSAGVTR